MKIVFNLFAILLAGGALLVTDMGVAEAKRFGGGQSFGGKFSHNQSLNKGNAAPAQKASPAQQRNAERKQQLAQRGGFMGVLGALAVGGLLGALFFGGAFEGVNFMDAVIFGMIIFLLFKLMTRREQTATAYGNTPFGRDDGYQHYEAALNDNGGSDSVDMLRNGAPRDFDRSAFVAGARSCFARLQQAWDEGDLSDIRQFTTDHVFGEIQEQYRASGSQERTEIVSLEAELLSATDSGSKQEVIVLFHAELKEGDKRQAVDEVWHFVKANTRQTSWLLDGIQQVEG